MGRLRIARCTQICSQIVRNFEQIYSVYLFELFLHEISDLNVCNFSVFPALQFMPNEFSVEKIFYLWSHYRCFCLSTATVRCIGSQSLTTHVCVCHLLASMWVVKLCEPMHRTHAHTHRDRHTVTDEPYCCFNRVVLLCVIRFPTDFIVFLNQI